MLLHVAMSRLQCFSCIRELCISPHIHYDGVNCKLIVMQETDQIAFPAQSYEVLTGT